MTTKFGQKNPLRECNTFVGSKVMQRSTRGQLIRSFHDSLGLVLIMISSRVLFFSYFYLCTFVRGRFFMFHSFSWEILFVMREILYAWRERGRNSVQAGDFLSMRESWQPWTGLEKIKKVRVNIISLTQNCFVLNVNFKFGNYGIYLCCNVVSKPQDLLTWFLSEIIVTLMPVANSSETELQSRLFSWILKYNTSYTNLGLL